MARTSRSSASICTAGTSPTRSGSAPTCASRCRRSVGGAGRATSSCRTTSPPSPTGTRPCRWPRSRPFRTATPPRSSRESRALAADPAPLGAGSAAETGLVRQGLSEEVEDGGELAAPVRPLVPAGAFDPLVIDASGDQTLVEPAVLLDQQVVGATTEVQVRER